MNYKIHFSEEKVIIKHHEKVQKDELKHAFIDVTEIFDFEDIKYIVHDFSSTSFYPDLTAKNYISKAKTVTQFYSTWNEKIKVIVIAKNEEIRQLFSEVIKNGKDLIWKHFLFNDWDEFKRWNCNI